jgi:hypothetical protein
MYWRSNVTHEKSVLTAGSIWAQGHRVAEWIKHGLGLPQYVETFRANAITVRPCDRPSCSQDLSDRLLPCFTSYGVFFSTEAVSERLAISPCLVVS